MKTHKEILKQLENRMFIFTILFVAFIALTCFGSGIEIRYNIPFYSIRIALFFALCASYNFIKAIVKQIIYEPSKQSTK